MVVVGAGIDRFAADAAVGLAEKHVLDPAIRGRVAAGFWDALSGTMGQASTGSLGSPA